MSDFKLLTELQIRSSFEFWSNNVYYFSAFMFTTVRNNAWWGSVFESRFLCRMPFLSCAAEVGLSQDVFTSSLDQMAGQSEFHFAVKCAEWRVSVRVRICFSEDFGDLFLKPSQ